MTATVASDEDNFLQQIQFARHSFDNLQTLIRASDAKAAAFVTILIFLTASLLQVAKDAVAALHWHPYCLAAYSTVFLVASLMLLLAVLYGFVAVYHVLKARGARYYDATNGPVNLMWQDHILMYRSNATYYSALRNANEETLLRNITDQVFELAHISKEKMDALKSIRTTMLVAVWSWALAIGASLILLKYK